MSRQTLGWGLVGLAGLLLVAQLVPALAGKPPARPGVTPSPTVGRDVVLLPRVTSVEYPRGDPRLLGDLLVYAPARGANDRSLALRGAPWYPLGAPAAALGTIGQMASGDVSQSPDGHMLRLWDRVVRASGQPVDLFLAVPGGRAIGYRWREDSAGLCALQPEVGGRTRVTEVLLSGPEAAVSEASLPDALTFTGQVAPQVLACTAARHAIVGEIYLDGTYRVFDVDLGSGAATPLRSTSSGVVSTVVADPKGTMVAYNAVPAPSPAGPSPGRTPGNTQVRSIADGKLRLDLGRDRRVLAFSGDGAEVLIGFATAPGAQVVRVADGGVVWSEQRDRFPLGFLAHPETEDFAVAMGARNTATCERGEPGKYPQFCSFQPTQELVRVQGESGRATTMGAGIGAWGYAVP